MCITDKEPFDLNELNEKLKYYYYTDYHANETNKKRFKNINSLFELIEQAKSEKCLIHGSREELLEVFRTKQNEIIYIQYPGKETKSADTSGANDEDSESNPYDFRPKLQDRTGNLLDDLKFEEIFRAFINIAEKDTNLLAPLSSIFFHLGRMTWHREETRQLPCTLVGPDGEIIESEPYTRTLAYYNLRIDEGIINLLNQFCSNVKIETKVGREIVKEYDISLEALLYYFELILQNEDDKYYFKKIKLGKEPKKKRKEFRVPLAGRIPSSNSFLYLAAYLKDKYIDLPQLLQAFVAGRGTPRGSTKDDTYDFIKYVTDNIIQFKSAQSEWEEKLTTCFPDASQQKKALSSSSITFDKTQYKTFSILDSPRLAILNCNEQADYEKVVRNGRVIYGLEDIVEPYSLNNEKLTTICKMIKNYRCLIYKLNASKITFEEKKTNKIFKIHDIKYPSLILKIEDIRVAVFSVCNETDCQNLTGLGWSPYTFDDLADEATLLCIIERIKEIHHEASETI